MSKFGTFKYSQRKYGFESTLQRAKQNMRSNFSRTTSLRASYVPISLRASYNPSTSFRAIYKPERGGSY